MTPFETRPGNILKSVEASFSITGFIQLSTKHRIKPAAGSCRIGSNVVNFIPPKTVDPLEKSICSDRRCFHQVIFPSSRFHPTEGKKSPFPHSCKPSEFRRMRPRALSSVPLPHKRQTENQTNNNNKTTAVADEADQHHTYLSLIHQNSRTGRNPYHHHH